MTGFLRALFRLFKNSRKDRPEAFNSSAVTAAFFLPSLPIKVSDLRFLASPTVLGLFLAPLTPVEFSPTIAAVGVLISPLGVVEVPELFKSLFGAVGGPTNLLAGRALGPLVASRAFVTSDLVAVAVAAEDIFLSGVGIANIAAVGLSLSASSLLRLARSFARAARCLGDNVLTRLPLPPPPFLVRPALDLNLRSNSVIIYPYTYKVFFLRAFITQPQPL